MAKNTDQTPETITEEDLRKKLTSFQDGLQGAVEERRTTIVGAVAGAGLVLMVVFFLLGKRSGKKKSTIVEIRRV